MTSFGLLVCGSRQFHNYPLFCSIMDDYLSKLGDHTITIISGGALGADYFAEKYAQSHNLDLLVFKADWKQFGKKAGFIRNREMHVYLHDNFINRGCIAFWDGQSHGTAHNFELVKEFNTELTVYNYTIKDFVTPEVSVPGTVKVVEESTKVDLPWDEQPSTAEVKVQNSTQTSTLRVIGGLETKSDFRAAYTAQADCDYWNYLASSLGCDGWQFTKDATATPVDSDKPKAKIRRKFNTLHGSYAPSTGKVNETAVKKMVTKMNFEELNGYQFKSNAYNNIEDCTLIEITGVDYKAPYLIISALKVEDEHDRLTITRQMDETSEFFFTFNTSTVFNKIGMPVDHPELERLRKWVWNKVDHSNPNSTIIDLVSQMVGKVISISSNEWVYSREQDGSFTKYPNPEFIGYSTYDIEERIGSTFDRTSRDYKGAYTNIHISHRDIEENNGDIRFEKTNNSVKVLSGNKLLRTYHIFGTDED